MAARFRPRTRTNAYWVRRAEERLTRIERQSLAHLREIEVAYDTARRRTVRDVQAMYAAHFRNEGWDVEALRSIAPAGNLRRFHDEMKRLGLDTALPANYSGRMNRLELLNAQMWAESKKAALAHNTIQTRSHIQTINEMHNRTAFDISRGIGATPAFSRLDTRTVNSILNTKFQGKNYSQRIWGNTTKLADTLKSELTSAVATGQDPEKTIRMIRNRFGVAKSDAARLLRTETNFFSNKAELEAYESMGIERYKFSATLDGRTSTVCQDLDGEVFKVEDAQQGINAPPMHPNCRSTVVGYWGKEWESETRIARDPETGRNKFVSGSMAYGEWAKQEGIALTAPTILPGMLAATGRPLPIVQDWTNELLAGAQPGSGVVRKANGYPTNQKPRFEEVEAAHWLRDNIGGSVRYVPRGNHPTYDFRWRRQNLELKTLLTNNLDQVSKRIREGSQQIGGSGGLFLNISGSSLRRADLMSRIKADLARFDIDFVIVRDGDNLLAYLVKGK
ncbi:minor capsid protein [Candidatus Saccharibacteria bacterium]|nr:minor capsid protein [Candidatus Saccharibacteria bacterium]